MVISRSVWDKYIQDLRKINDKAAELASKYLATHEVLTQEGTDALIDYCFALATKYGEAAAELAAEMYDALAALSGVTVPAAVPAATPTISEVAEAVVGTMKTGNNEIVSGAVGRLVKRTGVDTTMQNALRDGAWWAWIPRGETCAFCIMLASRGWQRASKKAIKNGHAEHIHANCDCTYAVKFDMFSDVEGYDPQEYEDMYNSAEGSSYKQKVNSMRREFYARNKEAINEQKRDAYEKRKERESSAAEEINIS